MENGSGASHISLVKTVSRCCSRLGQIICVLTAPCMSRLPSVLPVAVRFHPPFSPIAPSVLTNCTLCSHRLHPPAAPEAGMTVASTSSLLIPSGQMPLAPQYTPSLSPEATVGHTGSNRWDGGVSSQQTLALVSTSGWFSLQHYTLNVKGRKKHSLLGTTVLLARKTRTESTGKWTKPMLTSGLRLLPPSRSMQRTVFRDGRTLTAPQ